MTGVMPNMMGYIPSKIPSLSDQGRPRGSSQNLSGQQQSAAVISRGPRPPQEGMGPSVTVFVGNITDRAPDNMVRQILQHCGSVVSWKRVQGASGVLQAFGFCEYSNPDSALRSIRLLHDLEIGEKKLVVKVDAKTKVVLDNYKAEKMKAPSSGGSATSDDEFLTPEQKVQDKWVKERIGQTLKDFESEMQANQARAEEKERREQEKEKARAAKKEEANNLDMNKFETEIEEGKKDLITREIGKFREIAKKQDEEKEAERKRRKEKERERDRDRRDRDRDGRDRATGSGRDRERERDRERDRARERDRDRRREREKENENHRGRSRTPGRRSRSPPGPPPQQSTPPRSRSRDRTERMTESEARPPRRTEKDYLREKEEEEEALERKKAEKKAREKEVTYQERLRQWEARERKKSREYEKLELKEKERAEEQQKQAVWLKQFLEDYDDERDDTKYYKGREMERRRAEREREVESDVRDRQKEKEELEELRNKIFAEGHSDPSATFEKACYEHEQQYKPRILLPTNHQASPPPLPAERLHSRGGDSMDSSVSAIGDLAPPTPPTTRPEAPTAANPYETAAPTTDDEEFSLVKEEVASTSPLSSPPSPKGHESKFSGSVSSGSDAAIEEDTMGSVSTAASLSPVQIDSDNKPGSPGGPSLVFNKRKKLEIRPAFTADEDELTAPKKRKLVPLDYDDLVKKDKDKEVKNPEEKRKHIKSLIEKIPTDKASLFEHPVEWSLVDNTIMDRRIKPWVNKKIVEYIGEPEPALVEFICSKVLAGSAPQSIINDVQMVLDEEAEVFVVKMWRLLIYELEAKKLSLIK